jgi:hypothetical protein
MAPFDNDDTGWINTAWSEYTDSDAPWIKISKTARAILIVPVLAVLVTFAELIETWVTEIVINPLAATAEFGADMVDTIFFGALGRTGSVIGALEASDPVFGFVGAIGSAWADVSEFVGAFWLGQLPVAVIVVLVFAFVLGKVINRG